METYTIQRACGHEERHSFGGSEEKSLDRLRLLSNTECGNCRHKKEYTLSQHNAEMWNLPALTGNRLEEANIIRNTKYNELRIIIARAVTRDLPQKPLVDAFNRIFAHDTTEFWLDYRYTAPAYMLAEFIFPEGDM